MVLPVMPSPGTAESIDRELAGFVRRRNQLMTIKQIAALDEQPAAAPVAAGVPAPVSLTEALSVATTVAGMHKGVAETAIAERNAAETRVAQVTADADKRAEAVRTEERTQAGLLLKIVQEFTKAQQDVIKASHETQLTLTEKMHEAEVKALGAKVEGMIDQFKAAAAQKDQEIDRLREQAKLLASRETVEDLLTKLVIQGKTDDPIVSVLGRLLAPAQAAADDPNRIFQTGIAQVEVEKARRELVKQDQEIAHAGQRHQRTSQLIDAVTNLVVRLPEILPNVLGGLGGAQAAEQSGVPSDFPAEPGPGVIPGAQ
ncbi:MAG TPA: hypothetical protein VGK74_22265 [Symbiobacteriaceae bacterium]